MPKKPRLEVTKESSTGLNTKFRDTVTNKEMNRGEVANRIEKGEYPDYHVAHVDGKRIVKSNPDNSKKNNLD